MSKDQFEISNITLSPDLYFPCTGNQFWVKVTHPLVSARGRKILIGDAILIDPSRQAKSMDMVLSGNHLKPFSGEQHDGVAVCIRGDLPSGTSIHNPHS